MHRSSAGHAGPVYCCARAGVKGYLTAGKDGFIMLWDAELQKLKQASLRFLVLRGSVLTVNFSISLSLVPPLSVFSVRTMHVRL